MPNRLEISLNTIAGDVRDVLVSHARSIPKTWASMSEGEQRNFIEKAFSTGRRLAVAATSTVAEAGYEAVTVTVGKYTEDDKGVKAELRIEGAEDDDIVLLRAMRGRRALLILADATDYQNARGAVEVDLDQPELFGHEEDEGFGDLGDVPEAAERHPLIDAIVRTSGGNEGTVVQVYGATEEGLPIALITDPNGADFDNVTVQEVLVPEQGEGEQVAFAVMPVLEWLEARKPIEPQGIPAEGEWKASGIFEVGEPVVVPMDGGKTTRGEIIGKNKGGTQFTVRTEAGNELDFEFPELAAVNPDPAPGTVPAEGKKKSRKRPESPAAQAAADMGIGAE